MLRTILILGLAAGWVAAGEAPLDAFLYEKDFVLEAGGDEPLLAVHEMEEAGYEVHLLLEFPVGLYRITEMGKLKETIAGIMLEYNRADLPTDEKNPFRPAEFQQDANAEWNAGGAGEDVISGIWLTSGETTARVERVLIFSLPAFGRYRIRMSGLFENTRHMRRVPTLVGVAEVRSLTARGAGPEDVVDDVAEEEAEEVFEEEYGDEPETEVIVVPVRVVFAGPPACCPFCRAPFIRGQVTIGDCRHYSCSLCSGMVHCYRDGRRHCSNLRGGRRHKYDFRNGRPVRFDGRESAYPRRDRGAGDGANPRRRSRTAADRPPTRRTRERVASRIEPRTSERSPRRTDARAGTRPTRNATRPSSRNATPKLRTRRPGYRERFRDRWAGRGNTSRGNRASQRTQLRTSGGQRRSSAAARTPRPPRPPQPRRAAPQRRASTPRLHTPRMPRLQPRR